MLAPGDNIPAKIEKGAARSNILRKEGARVCGCVELTPFCLSTVQHQRILCEARNDEPPAGSCIMNALALAPAPPRPDMAASLQCQKGIDLCQLAK